MKTSNTQLGFCPICGLEIKKPNTWVRYHIRYGDHPIEIMACKYCNWTEFCLRNSIKGGKATNKRFKQVLLFHKKFGITL